MLTPELVARVQRAMEDTGLPPGLVRATDADWEATARELLASRPDGRGVWIFAYGSLLWRPAVEHVEEQLAVAHGWHRAFRMWIRDWRGTVEQPGRMMGLDRGGRCKGIVYRLPKAAVDTQLRNLLRREMPLRPIGLASTNVPRWIRVRTAHGELPAIAFVLNRRGYSYAAALTPDATADITARACGHGGSCAEYLCNTILKLEERGIHDQGLWRLQELVARKIVSRADLAEIRMAHQP